MCSIFLHYSTFSESKKIKFKTKLFRLISFFQTTLMVMQLKTDNQRMRLVLQQLQTEVGRLRNDLDRVKAFLQERQHILRRFRWQRRLYSGRVGSNQQLLPEEWDNLLITPGNVLGYGSSGRVTPSAGDLF